MAHDAHERPPTRMPSLSIKQRGSTYTLIRSALRSKCVSSWSTLPCRAPLTRPGLDVPSSFTAEIWSSLLFSRSPLSWGDTGLSAVGLVGEVMLLRTCAVSSFHFEPQEVLRTPELNKGRSGLHIYFISIGTSPDTPYLATHPHRGATPAKMR